MGLLYTLFIRYQFCSSLCEKLGCPSDIIAKLHKMQMEKVEWILFKTTLSYRLLIT